MATQLAEVQDKTLDYQLWDVFTDQPLQGNQLAIVTHALHLSDAQMQAIASEFNLSETAFLLPSEVAGARARYFTPAKELPVAGHPSIGVVYALHRLGRVREETFQLELGVGVREMRLELERNGSQLIRVWMNQGVPELLESYDKAEVAAALGLDESDLDPELPVRSGSVGLPFLYVPVTSLGALAKAQLTAASLAALMKGDHKAVFVFTRGGEGDALGADVRARMLGLAVGVFEDPATGSAHGPLGAYLAEHGRLEFEGDTAHFSSRQGVEMGRPSDISVRLKRTAQGYEVEVGGSAVMVGEGKLYL